MAMKQQAEKKQSPVRRLELLLAGSLYYSGVVGMALWRRRRSEPTLTILCYHRTAGGYLREHLLYLKRYYRLLHLEAALEELYALRKDGQVKRDRRPMLVLTFDDGYRDLLTCGLPLAAEFQVPLTAFLIPGYIESGQRFWWLEPEYLLSQTPLSEVTLQGKTYHLSGRDEKQALLAALEAGLRYTSSVTEREAFLKIARVALAVPFYAELSEEERELVSLNWAEVQQIERSSWISFSAHTMHHPILAYLANDADAHYELSECRTVLERQLSHPVRTFAYPVGKDEHIGEKGRESARLAGYSWAVTAIHGVNTPRTDPYALYRLVVDVDQHWLMVAAKASGVWDFLVHLGRMPVAFLKNMFK